MPEGISAARCLIIYIKSVSDVLMCQCFFEIAFWRDIRYNEINEVRVIIMIHYRSW